MFKKLDFCSISLEILNLYRMCFKNVAVFAKFAICSEIMQLWISDVVYSSRILGYIYNRNGE